MEWNQLQKFLIVAKEENFTKASQILNMTQPSLSQTIKRLESELGYQLFEREGKKIKLNESGRIFLQTVVQMHELMENTRLQLEELNHLEHPKVLIQFSTASKQLPELLLYLKKRNPHTVYQINQWQRDQRIQNADIQVLSCSQENFLQDTDEILLNEKILLALPAAHKLVKKNRITLNDLAQEEFIFLNDDWELGRIVKEELSRTYFTPKESMNVDNPNMMRELLNARLGIAFVPALSWDYLDSEEISLHSVEGIALKRTIYLRSKNRKYLTREQKECIEGIKEFFHMKYQINEQTEKLP